MDHFASPSLEGHPVKLSREWVERAEAWCGSRGLPLRGTEALVTYLENLRGVVDEQTGVFLDSIVENIPDMIFVKDARELRFQRLNRAGERLLGYSREALLGRNDHDFFPRDQADGFCAADRRVLDSKTLLDIPEEVVQTRSHGQRVLHTKKIPILNAHGEPTYLLGISEDVTERKSADEERMQLLEERAARTAAEHASLDWSLLAQVSSQLAASLDLSQNLGRVVKLLVPRMGDWTVAELRGDDGALLSSFVHHHQPERAEVLRRLQSLLPNRPAGFPWTEELSGAQPVFAGRPSDAALTSTAKNPEHLSALKLLRPESALVAPLVARNRVVGFLTVARTQVGGLYDLPEQALVHDLADRLALAADNVRLHQDAQQAIAARDAFLAVAAHELKTPLTTLQLHIQSLLRGDAQAGDGGARPTSSRALQRAGLQVTRLSALVNDLLDITRLGARQVALQLEESDLRSVVTDVLERMADAIARTRSSLTVQAPEPVVGRWDRLRLSQVLTNLVSNAMKYGGGSPIEVTVDREGDHARLRVRDHGIGIPPEHQARIFGPFQRAVSERHYGGLGLGLWITQQIVAAHGGTIQVESVAGEGATFTVDLPLSL